MGEDSAGDHPRLSGEPMKTRPLGNSSLQVSVAGLGCNNLGGRIDLETSRKVVHKALDLGITMFDTADSYGNRGGSERALGEILGARRKDVVLATKFGVQMDDAGALKGASRSYIPRALEASLKRLRTDWIDLYQVHWPDPQTPIEETLRALDNLVRQGKVRYIGCSNFAAWQMVEAQWTSRHHGLAAFVSCQNEYSLLVRDAERELVPAMRAYGLGLLPYFPLASGLLSGKYRRGEPVPKGVRFATMPHLVGRFLTDSNFAVVERLEAFARARGRTPVELAFGWLASQPTVASVIAGATRTEQVEQNAAAVGWTLGAEDLAELDRITASAGKA
jgi:aryl-alcohol dehydrogenase-like predicted oxidoreductase